MTAAYIAANLDAATVEARAARRSYETATTAQARRKAADALEFWSNKTAYFSHATPDTIEPADTCTLTPTGRVFNIGGGFVIPEYTAGE